jgi:uncharacterized surface protein with fasciclin (FAS1) repeats
MTKKTDSNNTNIDNKDRRKLLAKGTVVAGVAAASQTQGAKPVLDSIILPAHAQTSTQTIAAIAAATADLSTLVSVLTPGQLTALSGPGPLTVFAPTNAAFDAISATVATLTAAEVEAVVNYHVLSGELEFSALPATTGAAPSLVATVPAANGIVYVIDQVLLP